jgi:hypothetical protein
LNKPEIHSQNDETTGLKRLGGDASDTANRVPSDVGRTATDKINREQSQLRPDPKGMAGGFEGGRQFKG